MEKSFHKQTPFYKFSFIGAPERLREDSKQELELYLLDKSFEHNRIDSEFHQIACISDQINIKPKLTHYQSFLLRYSLFMDSRFELIRLESNWLLLWNLLNFFSICYYFVISLFVIFIISVESNRQRINEEFNQITKQIVACILFIDFFAVRFRIMVVHKGKLLRTHGQRLDHYLKGYFIIDLVSLLIILIDIWRDNLGFFALVFSIKIFVAMDISQQIFYKLTGHLLMTPLIKFLRILFMIAFFTFIFACIFVTVDLLYLFEGGFYEQYGFLWLTSSSSLNYINLYDNFSWIVWFQYALFMTLQMAVGCGYGRPSPLNPTSQFVFNVACLTCKVVWAYYTKQVFDICTVYFEKSNTMSDKLSKLNMLNQQENLQSQYRKKVRSYFRRQLENGVKAYEIQQHFSNILSEKLLKQFEGFYKQYFALRSTFLKYLLKFDEEDSSFEASIAKIVKGKFLHRDQILYQRNVKGNENLYLSEWKIIKTSNTSLDYKKYESQWSLFGIRQFFIDKRPFFDVKAKKAGLVEYIQKDDFLAVIKQYPKIYEKYLQKIHQLKFQRHSTEIIELKCWECEGYHLYENCPHLLNWFESMKLKQNSENLIHSQQSERKRFYRHRPLSHKLKDLRFESIEADLYCSWTVYTPEFNTIDFKLSV